MFLFIHYYSKHFPNVYRNARKRNKCSICSFFLPITVALPGYLTCFSALIPTTAFFSGYHTCFLLSHTHYSILLWVSYLLFRSPYPLLHSSLGITFAFPLSYPLLHSSLGIRLTFHSPIPTTPLCSGYHAYFFLSHTHIGTRNKNFLRSTGRNKQNDSLPPKTAANISIILELFP